MSATTEPIMTLDTNGNPVCRGCGADALILAARANSGKAGCFCPPHDRRIATPDDLAEARERMSAALDLLERLGHPLTCRCDACEAAQTLRRGSVVGGTHIFSDGRSS